MKPNYQKVKLIGGTLMLILLFGTMSTARAGATSALPGVATTVGSPVNSLMQSIGQSSDDAEEKRRDQSIKLSDKDLDLGSKNSVGLRFRDLAIPVGAMVKEAYLQFHAEDSDNEPTDLTIHAQMIGNAPTFSASNGNIISRITTASSVDWHVPAWTQGESTADQRSPDISSLIQEIIDSGLWNEGNAIVFLINGSGERDAYSYDKDPARAPTLTVDFDGGMGMAQVASPGISPNGGSHASSVIVSLSAPAGATLYYTTNGSEPDNLDNGMVYAGAFSLTSDTTVKVKAYEPGYSPSDTVSAYFDITAAGGGNTLDLVISQGKDDAEQKANNKVTLNNNDLDLGAPSKGAAIVGLRYNGVAIPPGATITTATLLFTAEESDSEATNLLIQAQADGNAPVFKKKKRNLSNRSVTNAQVNWSVPAWIKGDAGVDQTSPNLSALIQEIINRGDWRDGNSLALLLRGTGNRDGFSYNNDRARTAVLHIEFTPKTTTITPSCTLGTSTLGGCKL